jgi:hypothetical protein
MEQTNDSPAKRVKIKRQAAMARRNLRSIEKNIHRKSEKIKRLLRNLSGFAASR